MEQAQIGIVGGSGLYDMAAVTNRREVTLTTPFGEPSAPYVLGTLEGKRVAFLARHGIGHRISPSELNFRANIFGFKMLGVEYILSASAVGSLKEECKPLDIVIPDQFIDRTRGRIGTFFGRVRDLLKPDGVAVIHFIGRSEPPAITNPYIARYIFPGGYIPALSEMVAGSEGTRLMITDVEVLRIHYGLTIRDWGITWDEIEPSFDKFEYLCGISGKAGNIQGKIDPAGNIFEGPRRREYPMPPLHGTEFTDRMGAVAKKLGWAPFPGPAAINSTVYDERPGCVYHGY